MIIGSRKDCGCVFKLTSWLAFSSKWLWLCGSENPRDFMLHSVYSSGVPVEPIDFRNC